MVAVFGRIDGRCAEGFPSRTGVDSYFEPAARSERISFNQIHPRGSRINSRPVPHMRKFGDRSEVVKGYEHDRAIISVHEEELKRSSLSRRNDGNSRLVKSEIDPVTSKAHYAARRAAEPMICCSTR
jgi:non-homologous end joining protein Ku